LKDRMDMSAILKANIELQTFLPMPFKLESCLLIIGFNRH
jgi:hypothetical protein